MQTVTVSPKFQVIIPADIRRNLNLQVGQKMQIVQCGERIELLPVKPVKTMRGFLRGIDTDVPREADRV
ncbi:AbrB/MazE/SpoVT family DNA-binding domain-containing protein [Beggiatoa leptomitoformis]|uniref:AbrB family transcriptional regulator n=1 Tax=Beggiatoa leptomitoformis TaxID=288004 RepID=A0A2N9YC60_9GAMM|nr:AbrB/MazE/SpoVT family DNA-binding domain-containing protein [Beggiatoa leptomitoformis]ALG66635.1 AbrB family transcriptional regulator [Beggiatoa leptomitoformis]AUI68048.1 AbrB family transcriptional regulator [Beggiatoa leptomitoformis]